MARLARLARLARVARVVRLGYRITSPSVAIDVNPRFSTNQTINFISTWPLNGARRMACKSGHTV